MPIGRLTTEVTEDRFYLLGPAGGARLPNVLMPKLMSNHGNFVGSLGNVARYLGRKAEALGIDVYPGFAAAEVLYGDEGEVVGVATGDMGVGKDGSVTEGFTRGMELRAKYTLFAEGARGSLSKELIARFDLHRNGEPQKYGIGLKELWRVDPSKHQPGLVQHSFGWPLDNATGGGSFLYHLEDNQVVGRLRGAPELHQPDPLALRRVPALQDASDDRRHLRGRHAAVLRGARHHRGRLAVGAAPDVSRRRAGGLRGGLRQRAAHQGIAQRDPVRHAGGRACGGGAGGGPRQRRGVGLRGGLAHARRSAKTCAACATSSRCGRSSAPGSGVPLGGLDMWMHQLFGGSPFGTLKHGKPDYASLKPIAQVKPLTYPKPDGVLTFDKLSSVFLSGTNHEENQPAHLVLTDPSIPIRENLPKYGEPARLYCPAGVYEVVYARCGPPHRSALRHQRAELRALQDLRHQGSGAEHHLGSARGRRRAGLPEHVTGGRSPDLFRTSRAPRPASPDFRLRT